MGRFLVLAAAPLLATAAVAQSTPDLVETPVLGRTVEQGELLSADDFTVEALRPAQARGAIIPADAAGKEARRRLQAGATVRGSDLIEPQVVRRGEPVVIMVRAGGLSITAPGRALSSAAAGEPVRVVSTSTNRTLDGVAEAAGQVRVGSR